MWLPSNLLTCGIMSGRIVTTAAAVTKSNRPDTRNHPASTDLRKLSVDTRQAGRLGRTVIGAVFGSGQQAGSGQHIGAEALANGIGCLCQPAHLLLLFIGEQARLAGMRRFQSALYPDGDLPGNAIAPNL